LSFAVRVEPAGLQFEAAPGESLVWAAQHAGIELPTSCRNGTCRTCLCQIKSGQARHLIDWPGVSAEEKAENWILPCVAEALSDLTLEVPLAYSIF
jgi:ferredoxin